MIIFLSIIFIGLTALFLHFINKKFEARKGNSMSPYQIGFIALVSEFVFMVLGKSFAFYFWYSWLGTADLTWSSTFFFWGPFSILVIAMPINIMLIVLLNCLLLPIANRVISPRGGATDGK